MWKLLSGVAALFCLLAAVFAYLNYNTFRLERTLSQRAEQNLSTAAEHQQMAETVQAEKNVSLKEREGERNQAQTLVAEKKAEAEEVEAEATAIEEMLAERTTELEKIESELTKTGDIDVVRAKLQQLENEILSKDEEIASYKSLTALAAQELADAERAMEQFRKRASDQASGKMAPISARIEEVIDEFGFVVINAGNNRGVVPNVRFDVLRGGSKIGEVVVENVEPGSSAANIDESTVAEGVSIQAGDTVSVSPSSQS